MRYTILLNKDEKTKEVETQEQARFLKAIFEALGVPIEWNTDEPLSIEERLRLRKLFEQYNINVISDSDGGLKVFANAELIGEWFKCSYKLKKDPAQMDPRKKLYLEMQVNFWTTFEKNE